MNLRDWRKSKGWGQADLADKIGSNQKTYSAYETGRLPDIPPDIQARLRKLGYTGHWPREKAQDAAAGGPAPYVTREEFGELKGALKTHVEQWEKGQEKVLQRLEDALRRIEQLERGGG